ncbi:MAG: PKD domain-containing protein [Planctomycetota bacterium]
MSERQFLARIGVAAILFAFAASVHAQNFSRGGVEFQALRSVSVTAGAPTRVLVTEFFHHGLISADGRNVFVVSRRGEPAPFRMLQLGPGDFCRIAIQVLQGSNEYDILYGGAPPTEAAPKWTNRDGLLLETRYWKNCDLSQFESVRAAFESSKPYGADYVEAVHHATNPFSTEAATPFLSRYTGELRIASPGRYGFFTASQDASFLLIDDKVVASDPGRHPAARRARPEMRSEAWLDAGQHKFEYYHAASRDSAIMAAAWEPGPGGEKPAPVAIPPEAFDVKAIGRAVPSAPSTPSAKIMPDFLVRVVGDVPLPDNPELLVGVEFRNNSPKSITSNTKILWEFGDGQSSDKLDTEHVYLRPGVYNVTLTVKRGAETLAAISNRVAVAAPQLTFKDKLNTLDEFLPVLQSYDPRKLDALSLKQLVLAFEAKADELRAKADQQAEEARAAAAAAEAERAADGRAAPARRPPRLATPKKQSDNPLLVESLQWTTSAVEAGKVAFVDESAAKDDEPLGQLARLVGPKARDQLGNSELAYQIYRGAYERIRNAELKAEFAVEAADVAINDLLKLPEAKALLDDAAGSLGRRRVGAMLTASLKRVWGDYYAATGDGEAARKAYLEAQEALASAGKRFVEQAAWRGAYSRSTEDFLQSGQLGRAAGELHAWQREFPTEKLDGYLTLMYARYWQTRQMHDQAVAQSEQLMATSPESPYVDRVLLLAAESEVARSKPDRAIATLHSLIRNYPGSEKVTEAKKRLAELEAK